MPSERSTFKQNLPAAIPSFIGRKLELGEIRQRLREHRLATLTGTGGTGKTRLAFEAAAGELDQFADGVWLVEFAGLAHGAALMFANQIRAATARLDAAEQSVQGIGDAKQIRDLQGQIAAVRGNLARLTGDLPRAVALAEQALAFLPENGFLRVIAQLNAAYAYLVHSDVTLKVERQVTGVLARVRATGNLATILRSVMLVARMHIYQGRLRQVAAVYDTAAQVVSGPAGSPALINSAAYAFGLGDLQREWKTWIARNALSVKAWP